MGAGRGEPKQDVTRLLRLVGHDVVARLALVAVPAGVRRHLIEEAPERGRLPAGGEDVDAARDLRFLAGVAHGLEQRQQRMAADHAGHRLEIDRADRCDEAGGELLAVDVPVVFVLAGRVPQRLAVGGQERVDVDDCVDACAEAGGDAGNHHAAVGMAGEDEAVEAFLADLAADVVDVIGQRDPRMQLVRAHAEPGQRGHDHAVAGLLKLGREPLVSLPAAPGAMDQHVIGHRLLHAKGKAREPSRFAGLS